jgi:predicted neuraminidase
VVVTSCVQAGVLGAQASAPGLVRAEFIFTRAAFASAHASTIVETPDGLVAAWFGGSRESAPDVGIWLSRQADGEWTPPVEVANGVQADGTRYPCYNPVLFRRADGTLLLFFKVGPGPQRWWGMLTTSADNGHSWSTPHRLPDGILGPIKNKPVRLADGTLLSPSSTESTDVPSRWRVHFERSVTAGSTWSVVRPAAPVNGSPIDAIQPSILVHGGGRLQAVGRTRSERIFETWSEDGGVHWSPLTVTDLPNPNSGIDAVSLTDGRQLLVYNHSTDARTPLNVAISGDGKTWEAALVLEDAPGEYSYPAVIQSRDGLVHVTYTWRRQRIRHVVIDPAALRPVPMRDGVWPSAVRRVATAVGRVQPDWSPHRAAVSSNR